METSDMKRWVNEEESWAKKRRRSAAAPVQLGLRPDAGGCLFSRTQELVC